jgi:hypothetical protein
MALTGKFRFRKTLSGKIVLQFEEEVKPFWRRYTRDQHEADGVEAQAPRPNGEVRRIAH